MEGQFRRQLRLDIKAKLWEDEVKFNVNLNGDGHIGLQPVEANR